MKRFSMLGWGWATVLAAVSALLFTGCRTGAAWRADGPRDDAARVSEDVSGDHPCRFG